MSVVKGSPIYLIAAAAVVVILASGAVSRDSALRLKHQLNEEVYEALHRPLRVLPRELGQRAEEHRLPFDDYPVSRAQARLGPRLVTERQAGEPMVVWIPEDTTDEVIQIVASDLHRRGIPSDKALRALNATIDSLSEGAAVLASAGLAADDAQRRRWLTVELAGVLQPGQAPAQSAR